jgi:RHS repeat-associated protein
LGILNLKRNVQNPVVNITGIFIFERGNKFFELSNHLGNVLVTVSDKKIAHDAGNGTIDYYTADVVTANDYYPFGMRMPWRKYSNDGNYRYGFNGKENDKDISEGGQDYGMRIYDSRLGRFLSVDPIEYDYPELTPYQFASNNPIALIDIDGLEGWWPIPNPIDLILQNPVVKEVIEDAIKELRKLFRLPPGRGVPIPIPIPVEIPVHDPKKDKPGDDGAPNKPSPGKPNPGEKPIPLTPPVPGKDEVPDPNGKVKPGPGDKDKPSPGPGQNPHGKPGPGTNPGTNPSTDPSTPGNGPGNGPGGGQQYEQYVLEATKNGKFPVMRWGDKEPVGFVKLKKGDTWKYGTTVNPKTRYSLALLRRMNLTKRTQARGSLPYVLIMEGLKIINYVIQYGKLPPGNKGFK